MFTKEELKSILGFVKSSYQCEMDASSYMGEIDKEHYLQQAKNWKSIGKKIRKRLKANRPRLG